MIAELIGGELARLVGLKIPEIVFATLDEAFGRTEPDEEIQDLLKASVGLNLGLHYLSGSITFDPIVTKIPPYLASKIVWLDCLLINIDRTARNTNMLIWKNELWLIDHGAALYFHHAGLQLGVTQIKPFPQVKDHVLLEHASELKQVNSELKAILTPKAIADVVALVPDEWLKTEESNLSNDEKRAVYANFLNRRIQSSDIFINEAQMARNELV